LVFCLILLDYCQASVYFCPNLDSFLGVWSF
jgi:hypothetical protein